MAAVAVPTIWISRPPPRAQELADALAARGVRALLAPAMHIADVPGDSTLATYLAAAETFAVSIFISQEAAARTAARLPAGTSLSTLPALAIGAQTAAALHPRYHLLAAAAEVGSSEDLLQSAALRACRGRIAIVGGTDEADAAPAPQLLTALRERGDEVLPVVCYRRTAAAADAQLSQRGKSGQVQAAVAYSSDTLRYMVQMTAPDNDWLKDIPLFVIHANIAATARDFGFREVHCISSNKMAEGIAEKLVA